MAGEAYAGQLRRPTPVAVGAAARSRRVRLSESGVLFAVASVAYLAIAWWMYRSVIVFPDAYSRLANGFYVIASRDPHLPAVGFVFGPLMSLVVLPLVLLRGVFPPLATHALAGGVMSALFMAGAVALLAGTLRRAGVTRLPRLALAAAFALHPMILIYGGSGMTEGAFLFFLLLATRGLVEWFVTDEPFGLVVAGVALGLGYLTRYEALAAGAAGTVLVLLVTYLRTSGPTPRRRQLAINDAALVGLPFAFAVVLWSVSSKVLVNQWLPVLSSQYGNSAQTSAAKAGIVEVTGGSVSGNLRYAITQVLGMEPLLPLLAVVALVLILRRNMLSLIAWAMPGAVLAFAMLAYVGGSTFGWLRFKIAAIPLSILLAGFVLAQRPRTGQHGRSGRTREHDERDDVALGRVRVVAVVAAVVAAIPVTLVTIASPRLAPEESSTIVSALRPATKGVRVQGDVFRTERAIAARVDKLGLPDATVLTDAAYSFPMLLNTRHPKQYVIPSDRDFAAALARPAEFGIRYLLLLDPRLATADALEARYPTLYRNGAGITLLRTQWCCSAEGGLWRLYEVKQAR